MCRAEIDSTGPGGHTWEHGTSRGLSSSCGRGRRGRGLGTQQGRAGHVGVTGASSCLCLGWGSCHPGAPTSVAQVAPAAASVAGRTLGARPAALVGGLSNPVPPGGRPETPSGGPRGLETGTLPDLLGPRRPPHQVGEEGVSQAAGTGGCPVLQGSLESPQTPEGPAAEAPPPRTWSCLLSPE